MAGPIIQPQEILNKLCANGGKIDTTFLIHETCKALAASHTKFVNFKQKATTQLLSSSDFLCTYWSNFFKLSCIGYLENADQNLFEKAMETFKTCWLDLLVKENATTYYISVLCHFFPEEGEEKYICLKLHTYENSDGIKKGLDKLILPLSQLSAKMQMFYMVLDYLGHSELKKQETPETITIQKELNELYAKLDEAQIPKLIQMYQDQIIENQHKLNNMDHLNPNIKYQLTDEQIRIIILHGVLFLLLYATSEQYVQYGQLLSLLDSKSLYFQDSWWIKHAITTWTQVLTAQYYGHEEFMYQWVEIFVRDTMDNCPILIVNKQKGGDKCLTCQCIKHVFNNQNKGK